MKRLLNLNHDNNAPYHTILYSKNQLIQFVVKSKKFTNIEYKIYETGWLLKGNGFIKNIIANISLYISKIPFLNIFMAMINIVFKKNENKLLYIHMMV